MNYSSPEFLKLLKERDHQAVSSLINDYHEALIKGALKQGIGVDQAEEVVQATWTTLFEKVDNFEGRSHIRTYLFGIMYNKIKELWRSNKKYTHNFEDEQMDQLFDEFGGFMPNTSPIDPSIWTESQQFISILEEELDTLPPNQRMAFVLKEVERQPTEEICKILDVSSTNLGVLIYRAKNALRVKIEKRYKQEGTDG